MKKIIANLLSIPLIPVILCAMVWTWIKEAWEIGECAASSFVEWLNS